MGDNVYIYFKNIRNKNYIANSYPAEGYMHYLKLQTNVINFFYKISSLLM